MKPTRRLNAAPQKTTSRQEDDFNDDFKAASIMVPLEFSIANVEPVYFILGRTSSFSDAGKTITYDRKNASDASLMNAETGVFIVPKDDKYNFVFKATSGETKTTVNIRSSSGKTLASSSYLAARQDKNQGGKILLRATANLKKGDQVSVFLVEGKLQENALFRGRIMVPQPAMMNLVF